MPSMTLNDFLRVRGANVSAIVAEVDSIVGLEAFDILLATGSIVEGLGNSKSDLDLLLITRRGKSSRPGQDNAALVVGRCLIDVQVLRFSELDELLGRLDAWSRAGWKLSHAAKFSLAERTLMHRLLHGRRLHHPGSTRTPLPVPRRRDLARLKLHFA